MPRTPKAPKSPRPATPQRVIAVLRKSGLPRSDVHIVSAQPHGWEVYASHWVRGDITVRCEHHPMGCDAVSDYVAALAAAGIAAEVRGGEVWVPVDQGQPSNVRDSQ
jgi:hypothetical protein